MNATKEANNPWFGVSMALIGVIVGYGIAFSMGGSSADLRGQVAEAPTKAAPTKDAAPTPAAPKPAAAGEIAEVDPDNDIIRGDLDASVSLIEYSDYECPFCTRVHATLKTVIEEVDDVNWVYRHYPLSFHPNAKPAAEGAFCVLELGGNEKAVEYTDIVFDNDAVKANLPGYAEQIGVDKAKFEECLNSGKFADAVDAQMKDGQAGGVRGTPGTIVKNNETGKSELVSGAQGAEAFKAAIERVKAE